MRPHGSNPAVSLPMGIRSMSLKRGNPRPRTAEGRWYAVGGNHERGKWGLCPQTTLGWVLRTHAAVSAFCFVEKTKPLPFSAFSAFSAVQSVAFGAACHGLAPRGNWQSCLRHSEARSCLPLAPLAAFWI